MGHSDVDALVRNIGVRGYAVTSHKHDRTADSIRVSAPHPQRKGRSLSLQTRLRQQNLLNNKHIPEVYLRSSVDQRLELLR